MPYITASIVIQLGATLYGPWQQLRKEGETGRKKLNQYTRYLTVMITLVQGYLAIRGLESQSMRQGISAVVTPGLLFEIAGTVSLVGGTLFLMWIGEQITSRGIGNGISLIIMAGIIARLPQGLGQLLEGSRTGSVSGILVVGIILLSAALVLFICFMLQVMLSQFILKVSWETLLTPVTYAVVGWLKSKEGVDVYDVGTDFTPFTIDD